MSHESWLWEAQCAVFYGVWKLLGGLEAGSDECLRILALGGSMCCILPCLEAPGRKVGSMGDAACRNSIVKYGVLAKVGSMGDAD